MNRPTENVEQRLDMLMQVLLGLHEAEVITDPAVSAETVDEGTAVTVEFLLDFPRVAVVRPTRDQIARTIATELVRHDDGVVRDDVWDDAMHAAADAVLALFGVAVSDSQETPE